MVLTPDFWCETALSRRLMATHCSLSQELALMYLPTCAKSLCLRLPSRSPVLRFQGSAAPPAHRAQAPGGCLGERLVNGTAANQTSRADHLLTAQLQPHRAYQHTTPLIPIIQSSPWTWKTEETRLGVVSHFQFGQSNPREKADRTDVPSSATNPKAPETAGFGGQTGTAFVPGTMDHLIICDRVTLKIEATRASPTVFLATPQITSWKASTNSPPSRDTTRPPPSSR